MTQLFGASRQELIIAAVCLLAAVALMVSPPVDVGGMSVWFYLTPALIAAYCLPMRLFVLVVLVGAALGIFAVYEPQNPLPFIIEALASCTLLFSLGAWRQVSNRVDTLLVATTLLLFVMYPLVTLLNFYLSGNILEQALLAGTRHVLSSLIAILIAEALVISVALSRTELLTPLREALGLLPSLVHVVELIIGVAVGFSLILTLTLFWRSWDETLVSTLKGKSDFRFLAMFLAADELVERKLSTIALLAREQGLAEVERGEREPALRRLVQTSVPTTYGQGDQLTDVDIAIQFEDAILTSSGLDLASVSKGFAVAQAQVQSGSVPIDLRTETGDLRPGYARVDVGDDLPEVLLVFRDEASAEAFIYEDSQSFYNSLYDIPIARSGAETGDPATIYGLPQNADILSVIEDSWVVWKPAKGDAPQPNYRAFLNSVGPETRVTFRPLPETLARVGAVLRQPEQFRVTLPFWEFFVDYARAMILSTGVGLASLAVLLWFSRFLVGGLVSQLGELTAVFESWRQFRGGELGSGAALQAMDAKGFSSLSDIRNLQVGFRSLAQDVMYGERRLSTIAANYDELLRSLPLGVLAVDGASRVQFLNDALGDITEQRQDAIARLKTQAAQMLASNTTVEEWQLNLEDRPPKSLLLVVNHRLDDRGQESGLWVITTDLTEQKQTNAQLIQASKLATLGEMSTGMAHELNQPLNVISLATSNLRFSIKKGKSNPDAVLSKLDRIDGAVHRAASIIDHMRAYGRLAGEGLTEISVGEIVQGSCNLLSEQLKLANINLANEVPIEGLAVKGNAIQLEQVLINLINNAKDAIKDKNQAGEITVDAEVSGGRLLLRVTDSGGGIPDHVLPHIFEPFFTTKPVGKGTGLGGSISYGIVREMQGDIWAENIPGGAQITISLPLMP